MGIHVLYHKMFVRASEWFINRHKDTEGISILETLCAFYTQYPHGGPSMPMPTPGGPDMYPAMSNQMPPAMPSGEFPLWKKSFYS